MVRPDRDEHAGRAAPGYERVADRDVYQARVKQSQARARIFPEALFAPNAERASGLYAIVAGFDGWKEERNDGDERILEQAAVLEPSRGFSRVSRPGIHCEERTRRSCDPTRTAGKIPRTCFRGARKSD